MADKALTIKAYNPLNLRGGLTGKYHAICHYSYNLPLAVIIIEYTNVETSEERFNKLRNKCWDKSFHSFALGYIFDKKAQRYGFFVNLLKVFGIIVPSAIGATALGYGLEAELLKYMIVIAIPLTIFQLIFSVIAVTNKWDDKLAYAYEASQDLNLMFDGTNRKNRGGF